MHKKIILQVIIILLTQHSVSAQLYYRITFSDKKDSPWSLTEPEAFLSERSLERRMKQNIKPDSLDLPVNPHYIEQVLEYGVSLIHTSKWMNTITVVHTDTSLPQELTQLPFIRNIKLIKKPADKVMLQAKFIETQLKRAVTGDDPLMYGASSGQVLQLNLQHLHSNGYKGEGIQIAVLDAGFPGVESYSSFDSLRTESRIAGTRDFVEGGTDVYDDHYHGMSVLSIMAGNLPGRLIGTAPAATYWLLRSEDVNSEFPVEEDNWVAAAEFADSVGADIINSSLGYSTFDDPSMDYTYADMDGNTAYVTRGANIAASKGMLVISSAGNEGSPGNQWKFLTAPSDGINVIGVGAVDVDSIPAVFTSYGPAYGGAIKPNVTATGRNTILQRSDGTIGPANGTSYSSPVIAGAAACLWQANPKSTAAEVKLAIEKSAHLFHSPDSVMGYGIPDMAVADAILKSGKINTDADNNLWVAYPNPAGSNLTLERQTQPSGGKIRLSFFTLDGRLIYEEERTDASKIILSNLRQLPHGLLILHLRSERDAEVLKIIKSR